VKHWFHQLLFHPAKAVLGKRQRREDSLFQVEARELGDKPGVII
jgi:hypothetical protein